MWSRKYKDYPPDMPLKKEQVEPSKGIVGAEMHEYFGWGNSLHQHPSKKRGFLRRLLDKLIGGPP